MVKFELPDIQSQLMELETAIQHVSDGPEAG